MMMIYIYLQTVHYAVLLRKKAAKTFRLIELVANQDPAFNPDLLQDLAVDIYTQLIYCRYLRNYKSMTNQLLPELFIQLSNEADILIQKHEINQFEELKINQIRFIHLQYTKEEEHRQWTVLVDASYFNYYIDDISQVYKRGTRPGMNWTTNRAGMATPSMVKTYLTFKRENQRWVLIDMEQGNHSKYLKQNNVYEIV